MLSLRHEGGHGHVRDEVKGSQEALQRAKKVLRNLNELSQRIDEYTKKCYKVEHLFSPSLNGLRGKLREIAANFLFKTTTYSNQHTGILDYAWRKGSYEVIQTAKKLKQDQQQNWNFMETTYLKSHLVNCIGYYQHVLLELESGLDFELQSCYGLIYDDDEVKSNGKSNEDSEQMKKKLLFKCLMYMGDLSRYHLEFLNESEETDVYRKLSKRYYHQSLAIDSSFGQPFNQLATLSSGQGHGIISVYYYLRCLTSTYKFDGAEGNLKKLLEKSHSTSNEWKKMIANLMILIKDLLFEDSTKNLSDICKTSLDHVVQCTYTETSNSQRTLHGILSLLLVKDLLFADPKKATKASMIDAFLLAWFTHITTKILADLQYHLFGPDAMMKIFENKAENNNFNSKDGSIQIEEVNGKATPEKLDKSKKKDHRRRRTRHLFISDSEGSDLSENEENGDDDHDITDESEDEESLSELTFSEEDDDDSDIEDVLIEESEPLIYVKSMMILIRDHPMLESFQICCHWLKSNEKIIHEAGIAENSAILWNRLTLLLTKVDGKQYEKDELEYVQAQKNYAFPEDKISRGMKLFKSRQTTLDFDTEKHLSKDEIGMSRLTELDEFKHWLCNLNQSPFHLEDDDGSIQFRPNLGTKEDDDKQQNLSTSKVNLMENMAQLWLQQEVKDLEGHEELYSPYLVIDHLAMMNHMFAIRDIVASKKFAVIVPNAVVQQLDGMKKELKARNAIRWLEKQFQLGNRWLRGQKPNECKPFVDATYPSRKERDEWYYFKVFECLNYLSDQNRNKFGVTLLTSRDIDLEILKKGQKELGLHVETVDEFLTKCKIPKRKRTSPKVKQMKPIENG